MATTGHESEAINVQGLKASLQKLKTNHIDDKAGKSTTLAGYGITDAYTKSETYTKTEVNGLVDTPHQEYVTVEATSQTTAATHVLPNSGQAADTIYRVANWDGSANSGAGGYDVTKYSEYAWDDVSTPNKYVFLCVKSQIDEVFDISVYNNNAKYADLTAALGTNGANVPEPLRKGGMSVKFVQSSDNKYVQYFCNSQLFSTHIDLWEKANLEKELNRLNDKVDEFIGGTFILNPIAVDGIMVLTTIATQANHITYYVPVIQGKDINVKFTFDNNTYWSRRGYTTQTPENGVVVTGYAEGHSLNTTLTPPIDGYFVVSCEKTATHTIEITKEVEGIGHDVEQLQTQVGTNTTNIANNSDKIVENTYDIGVPVDYSKVIQSGATFVSFPIDVHLLKGLTLKITINNSPLSGRHNVYRCRGKETGIIDGITLAVGETKNVLITDETNYLWVYLAGTVSEESTISVTLQNVKGISTQVDKLLNTALFRYLYEGGFLYILNHCGSTDFIISFGRGGGNNLWDFRGFYTKDPDDDFKVANLTQFSYNDSDWFAPFKIRAINNIDGDDHELNPYNEYFTGGAHQYNNQQSGSTPTARGLNTIITIDGKPISSYSFGIGRVLKMTWINYIQAYNTRKVDGSGREVLKETITLTYDGIKWDAETILQPLEDIYLDLWYGYQTTGVGTIMSSHWRFINAVNRGEDPTESGNYNAIGFETYGGPCNVRCIVDNSFDIGNRELVYEESTQGAFKSGSKLYFLIDNKWSLLPAGNNYYLRGTYYIEKT